MPRTKLGNDVNQKIATKEKKQFSLTDIPNLSTTLTIEKAAEVSGVGYHSIKALVKEGKLKSIKCGEKKVVLPTWDFIIQMDILPESMLEKVYMHWLNIEPDKTA